MTDTLERALWTAAEAGLAVLLPALTTDILDVTTVKKVAIAVGIAALAALLTVIKQAIKEKLTPEV